jgi:hypothetical protein
METDRFAKDVLDSFNYYGDNLLIHYVMYADN